jgi:hypothetical protein
MLNAAVASGCLSLAASREPSDPRTHGYGQVEWADTEPAYIGGAVPQLQLGRLRSLVL